MSLRRRVEEKPVAHRINDLMNTIIQAISYPFTFESPKMTRLYNDGMASLVPCGLTEVARVRPHQMPSPYLPLLILEHHTRII